jgi:type VI secretion system protein ImpF
MGAGAPPALVDVNQRQGLVMARIDPQQALMPTVLDRLIDHESGGTAWKRGYSVAQMVDAVQRDLEDLLNTRQSYADLPEAFNELRGSIMGYGLPDLTSLNAFTQQQREDIGRVLEASIARFEPRLKDVRASLLSPSDEKERTLKFRIEARLCLDPAPEVVFDTVLEMYTGRYSVSQVES